MPYENLPERKPTYTYSVDMDRATVDDLDMFDVDTKTGNKQMLDFLDRVIVGVMRDGEVLVTRTTVSVPGENGEPDSERVDERAEGVRGKGIPYTELKRIFEAVGVAMKDAQNAKN